MGYQPHFLLAFGGHQGHAEEQWACGIRLAAFGIENPFESVDEEQYLNNTALPALQAWFGRAGSKIYSAARMQWVKFNAIRPDGRYADQGTTHERTVAYAAAATGNRMPLQACICLSWRTDAVDRGPGSRGRIYSPAPTVSLNGSTADIEPADRVLIADSAALLLNSLDAAIGGPLGAVLRPVIASKVGDGVNHQIDAVVVDSAMDIQRRRAGAQSREETRKVVAY